MHTNQLVSCTYQLVWSQMKTQPRGTGCRARVVRSPGSCALMQRSAPTKQASLRCARRPTIARTMSRGHAYPPDLGRYVEAHWPAWAPLTLAPRLLDDALS